jgi:hypothetical protein
VETVQEASPSGDQPVKVDPVNVKWRATASFLTEPYFGADAYVTKDGLMFAQVTTFDGAALKFKP